MKMFETGYKKYNIIIIVFIIPARPLIVRREIGAERHSLVLSRLSTLGTV